MAMTASRWPRTVLRRLRADRLCSGCMVLLEWTTHPTPPGVGSQGVLSVGSGFGAWDAGDTNGDAVSATITAPTQGWLLMTGSLDALGTTTDYFSCELQVDSNPVTGSTMSILVEDQAGTHTGNSEEDCSTTGAMEVGAGAHTIALVISGRETAQFFAGSVWALFVPFDGTGTIALPFDG